MSLVSEFKINKSFSKDDIVLLLDEKLIIKEAVINEPRVLISETPTLIGKPVNMVLHADLSEGIRRRIESFSVQRFEKNTFIDRISICDSDTLVVTEVVSILCTENRAATYLISLSQVEDERDLGFDSRAKSRMLLGISDAVKDLYSSSDIYSGISKALKKIGSGINVDRAYLYTIEISDSACRYVFSPRCEWHSDSNSVVVNSETLEQIPLSMYSDVFDQVLAGKVFRRIVGQLPESEFKKMLERKLVKSIIMCPVFVDDRFWGIVGFEDSTFERKWTGVEVSIFNSFSSLFQNRIDFELIKNPRFLSNFKAPKVFDFAESIGK